MIDGEEILRHHEINTCLFPLLSGTRSPQTFRPMLTGLADLYRAKLDPAIRSEMGEMDSDDDAYTERESKIQKLRDTLGRANEEPVKVGTPGSHFYDSSSHFTSVFVRNSYAKCVVNPSALSPAWCYLVAVYHPLLIPNRTSSVISSQKEPLPPHGKCDIASDWHLLSRTWSPAGIMYVFPFFHRGFNYLNYVLSFPTSM